MKMRLLVLLFILSCLLALPAFAQAAQHTVTLTWLDTSNPAGTTYSVYRASGLCSGTPVFSKLATGVTLKTFADSTVTPGNYCYAVTATSGGVESANSNTVNPAVPTFAPTGLSSTVAGLRVLERDIFIR